MSHTTFFYTGNVDSLASKMLNSGTEILNRVVEHVTNEADSDFDAQEIDKLKEFVERVCSGELPIGDTEQDWLDALRWICEVEMNSFPLEPFTDIRRIGLLQAFGIWPVLKYSQPPFPVPATIEQAIGVGFLSHAQIEAVALPALNELEKSHSLPSNLVASQIWSGVMTIRNLLSPEEKEYLPFAQSEFRYLLETAHGEGTDVVAIGL
ncbi:MAG: hypothetical protein ABL888_22700 [Pirellulaceae bacterium]